MKPAFKLTSLTLDPTDWLVEATFTHQAVTVSVRFPFHAEYDIAFGQVMILAEQRARDLLEGGPPTDLT